MKKLTILLFIFITIKATQAQNWQLVRSNKVQWYKGTDNYFKVIFADSVKFINGDSIFYFPVTIGSISKSNYIDRVSIKSPWWTGHKMILKPDGTQLFFSGENDTILIPVNKAINEEWIMTAFASGNYIMAKVISASADTILGAIDSTKTIKLQVYSKNNILLTAHKLHNQQFTISKGNGFVSLFPIFSTLDSVGLRKYYYNDKKYGLNIFKLTNQGKRLTNRDVYDFNVDDKFERWFGNRYISTVTEVLERTEIGNTIKYKFGITTADIIFNYKFISREEGYYWVTKCDSLFCEYYPEQYSMKQPNFLREFSYTLNTCDYLTISNTSLQYILIPPDTFWVGFIEPLFYKYTHAAHLGMIDSSYINSSGGVGYDYNLKYFKSDNCKIGTSIYGIADKNNFKTLKINPNPTNSNLFINSD